MGEMPKHRDYGREKKGQLGTGGEGGRRGMGAHVYTEKKKEKGKGVTNAPLDGGNHSAEKRANRMRLLSEMRARHWGQQRKGTTCCGADWEDSTP